jgi:hypothetical protein
VENIGFYFVLNSKDKEHVVGKAIHILISKGHATPW